MAIISLIAAMTENRCLGRDNKMPWHLPNDLARFKELTLRKPVIMGRKTYESIGRLLPGRPNIIVTRQKDFFVDGARIVHSLDEAFTMYDGEDELMVIGGAEIYQQALPKADRLYITWIHTVIEGDAFFPEWDKKTWHELSCEKYEADAKNPYDYDFVTLVRS